MKDYARSLQQRLEAKECGIASARDGILESFVVANRRAIEEGIKGVPFKEGDEEVYRKVESLMRELLKARGGSYEDPGVSELRSVRHTMDLKLGFAELPPEITENHDLVCERLLSKAGKESFAEGVIQPQPLDEPLEEVEPEGDEGSAQSPSQESVEDKLQKEALSPSEARKPTGRMQSKDRGEKTLQTPPPETQTSVPSGDEPEPGILTPVDDILSRIRPALEEMVQREVQGYFMEEREQTCPEPPSRIHAQVEGDRVFLAWLDLPQQPAYNVYVHKKDKWKKLSPAPLLRPSFAATLEGKGPVKFAVTSITSQGRESKLSEPVEVAPGAG